jgi:hypothetical protein
MTPASLTAASFDAYPAEGRALAQQYLTVLRSIPLAVLPGFLERIRSCDWQFPQEQIVLTTQLEWLTHASAQVRGRLFMPFAAIVLSSDLTALDWVHDPQGFIQALSAHLWQSRQIDSYRAAAVELFRALPAPPPPSQPALVVAVIGRDAPISSYPIFARMRSQGLYARSVSTEGAQDALLAALTKRASAAPARYAHWYIDGGDAWPLGPDVRELITHFTYPQLAPINDAVLKAMDEAVQQGTGPEVLESRLSHLTPAALGAAQTTTDPRLQHLYVSLLTTGSGTQIYSTSFLQAAAVEVLRRVRPSTLYFRFAPRRKQASINDLIEARAISPEVDPEGSLVDADMAAYYAYLELAKLPGGERASFVTWVEGRGEALVIGPNVTKGVESTTPLSMQQILALALT